MNDGDAIKRLLTTKSRVSTYVGRYAGSDGQAALVDVGDQRIAVAFETDYVPQINESVVIRATDGSLALVGPSTPKPGMGVVSTVSGDEVTVVTDFGTYRMTYAGEAPTSGDTVGISWSTAPWCVRLATSPDPVPPPPDPGGGSQPQVRSAEFRAVQAGSTDRGAPRFWTDRPYASNSTYGLWFYGHQIKDTIPASAEFVSLEIYIAYNQRQGDAPRFVLHSDFNASGIPAMTGSWTWDAPSGWQTPVNEETARSWFNALKAGGDRAGVGLNQGGYNIFKSLAQDGQSGALRITWRS